MSFNMVLTEWSCVSLQNLTIPMLANIFPTLYKTSLYYPWFQTFAFFWMLNPFFWGVPRRLNVKYRRRGITQKKASTSLHYFVRNSQLLHPILSQLNFLRTITPFSFGARSPSTKSTTANLSLSTPVSSLKHLMQISSPSRMLCSMSIHCAWYIYTH